MTETTTRIRWAASSDAVPGYGAVPVWRGHVGSCDPYLFLITKRSLDGDDYALHTELPWMSKKRSCDPDPEALKAEAERWLAGFVSSLGAVFPDEPTRPSRAWHADWAEVDRDQSGNAILRHKPTGGMYKILPAEEC